MANDIFEAIYLADASGHVVSVGLPASRQPYRDDYLGTDLSRRQFFTDARLTGKPNWSDTFLSVISGRVSVALAMPVKRQVLIGEININRLSEYLSHISAEKQILTIIIDRQGQIIAKPECGLRCFSRHVRRCRSVWQGQRSSGRRRIAAANKCSIICRP